MNTNKKIVKNLRHIKEMLAETEELAESLPPPSPSARNLPQDGTQLTDNPTPAELRDWRNERGYTQQQLATRLGVQEAAIQRWESFKRPMTNYLWLALNQIDVVDKENNGGAE